MRDKCVDFLTDINDEKVFMIIPPALSQQLIPVIHDILQLNTIFIVGNYSTDDELLSERISKSERCFSFD